jgi:hypothetical protein
MSKIAQQGQDITPIGKTSTENFEENEEEEVRFYVFFLIHITAVLADPVHFDRIRIRPLKKTGPKAIKFP